MTDTGRRRPLFRLVLVAPVLVSALVVITAATTSAAAAPGAAPTPRAGEYHNAVLNRDFPDPSVIKAANGLYFAYSTQADRNGRHVNIQVARSRNLVHWNYLGEALPRLPAWGDDAAVSWAPHVVRHRGRYMLFYSTVPDRTAGRLRPVPGRRHLATPRGSVPDDSPPAVLRTHPC